MLETRQASSDEELLSTDEMESDFTNEELAVNFDLPGKVFNYVISIETLLDVFNYC